MLRFLTLSFACALLALPAAAQAQAAPGNQAQTFPAATRLCASADAGTLPAKLAASAAQVKAACGTLTSSFTATSEAYTAATAPLPAQAEAAIAQARTTCEQALAIRDRAGCRAASREARTTLMALRRQSRAARSAYRTQVNAARKTFWSTVRALRGGTRVAPDKIVPAPAEQVLPTTV